MMFAGSPRSLPGPLGPRRPIVRDTTYSYTNNWPPEPLAGNFITADAITWSVISIIGLLGGTGLILYFFGRYDWLGWSEAGNQTGPISFRSIKWRLRRHREPLSGFSSCLHCCSSCKP